MNSSPLSAMPNQPPLPWQSPVDTARRIYKEGGDFAFCYSSLDAGFSGQKSLLAFHPQQSVVDDNFAALQQKLSTNQPRYHNAWFGYLGYGLRHDVEKLPKDAPAPIPLPAMWMTQFGAIAEFDHTAQQCHYHAQGDAPANLPPPLCATTSAAAKVANITSNMSKREYLQKVQQVREAILAGEIYQANLTRKFYGELAEGFDAFELFIRLCEVSPAPYSCMMRLGGQIILSSSPECFLTIDAGGNAQSRPIKGTAPRHDTPAQDAKIRDQLASSVKDKAENLMIVDLMRNDFSHGGCTPGSVKVSDLFEVRSYRTLHHMASTVHGRLAAGTAPLNLVKHCFPPGSMTGTPKIRAMEICSALELQERGIYAGALGWFGGDGAVDLSVVIRTLVLQGNRFEFQVGGAIVADSTAKSEWQETLTKSRGICQALGLKPEEDLGF
jgi:para-aminobenzoate synthetase component 1